MTAHPKWPPLAAALASSFIGAGCTSLCGEVDALPDAGTPSILAIGDSILAWHGATCQSIPDQASLALGRAILNRAMSGRRLSDGDSTDDIPHQYVQGGGWDWVIVTGGGNDVAEECGCNGGGGSTSCEAKVDEVIAEDGTGELVDLLDVIAADGPKVLLVGYYAFPQDSEWSGCSPYFLTLAERQAALAAARDGVEFLDLAALVYPEADPDPYFLDRVHPSTDAAARIGAEIAGIIGGRG